MSTYYMRDGQLFTTKTCCNLVETWQHEARVYPDEVRRAGLGKALRGLPSCKDRHAWDELVRYSA